MVYLIPVLTKDSHPLVFFRSIPLQTLQMCDFILGFSKLAGVFLLPSLSLCFKLEVPLSLAFFCPIFLITKPAGSSDLRTRLGTAMSTRTGPLNDSGTSHLGMVDQLMASRWTFVDPTPQLDTTKV
jgi:hypothetical protein